jgi:hypothetical protein
MNSPAPGLYWIRSDGSGEAQRLTDGKLNETPYSLSPDGKRLAFTGDGNGGRDIFTAPIEGDPAHVRLGKSRSCSWGRRLPRGPRRFRPTGVGLRISRMSRGLFRSVRAALSWAWRTMADFDGRRLVPALVAGRT